MNSSILCRFCSACVFMITGFFYPETVAKKRELKQFGKIFTITIGANLFLPAMGNPSGS